MTFKKLLLLFPLLIVPAFASAQEVQMRATTKVAVTITSGNTFQTILAAPVSPQLRRSLTIQNNNATDSCWVVIGGTLGAATKPLAILLLAGGSYTRYWPYIPSDDIHATCTSTNDTMYVDLQTQ